MFRQVCWDPVNSGRLGGFGDPQSKGIYDDIGEEYIKNMFS